MLASVKVHFKIHTNDYYNRIKYRTRTIEIDLVTIGEHRAIDHAKTAERAMEKIRETVIPKMKETVLHSSIIWSQIIQTEAAQ